MPTDQSAGSVTKKSIKATPGDVLSFMVTNVGASLRWFQIHDKATAPVATDVPLRFFPLPAGTAAIPYILDRSELDDANGIQCLTGIGWAISSTPATFTDAATAAEHTVTIRTT